ncbi:MAG: hypothetical protein ACREND_12460 [Gemmatimonadaceae bacterium]
MRLRHCTALVAFVSLAGCSAQTLLSAAFHDDTIGTPPQPAQTVGTVNVDNGDGTVLVVTSPTGNSEKWVQIEHNDVNGAQTGMQGVFAQRKTGGTFALLAVMYIPSGAGAATLSFEPFFSGPHDYNYFLHVDFMPDSTVRIDDGRATFGKFPHDQFFTISASLTYGDSITAHFQLLGTGASGSADYTLPAGNANIARDFNSIRFWMGSNYTGLFDVDNIIVTWH